MNASSHLLFAWDLGVLVTIHDPVLHPLVSVAALSLGALWPDLDHPTSTLGRWLPWPAAHQSRGPRIPPRVGRLFWPHPIWHRGPWHSLAFISLSALALSLLLRTWLPWPAVFWPFVLGGLSHLLLDNVNHEPMEWLAPWKKRWRLPLPAFSSSARVYSLTALLLTGGLVAEWVLAAPVLTQHLSHGALAMGLPVLARMLRIL